MTPEEFLQKTTYSWTTEEYNEALADAMKMGEGEWSKKWGPRIQINPKLSSDWIESDLQKKQSLEDRLKAEFGDSFDVDENWKNQVWQSKFSDVPKEQYEAALNKLWGEELDKGIQLGDEEQENIRKSKEYDRAQDVKNSKILSNLGNEYAIKRYIEGAPTWEVALNEAGGVIGEAANAIPTQTPYIGIAAGMVDPLVQAAQRFAYTPSEDYDLGKEAWRTVKHIGRNEATGLVGGKQGRKVIGDILAGQLGARGKTAKAIGDKVEELAEKHPMAAGPAATYGLRSFLDPEPSTAGAQAIKKAEENYKSATRQMLNKYKKYWKEGTYLPDANSSNIMKDAYKEYLKNEE